jgi:aspartyl-tRNA synthetase
MKDYLATSLRNRVTGALSDDDVGESVALCGWVHRRRDHGGLVFFDLRDRYGLVQCVASPERLPADVFAAVEKLRAEDVVAVEGAVLARPEESVNPEMATGSIEVDVAACRLLNESATPPFPVDVEKEGGGEVAEEVRLRHRYLELRRLAPTRALGLRHKITIETRRYLDGLDFWEIETPMLTRRTPEGARDFLVPSRVHPGKFYALPQSPQLYKQLLMVAGYDRYYQIARCFRDEDLRADRQPEFSQIDLEMSFVTAEDVIQVVTGLFRHLFQSCLDHDLGEIPTLTYGEAMARFGTDKPDLRIAQELTDVTDAFGDTGFRVFDDVVSVGGRLVALRVPAAGEESRGTIDRWTEVARGAGANGLVWARRHADDWRTAVDKFVDRTHWDAAGEIASVEPGDLLLVVAGEARAAQAALGELRLHVAAERDWVDDRAAWQLLWIVDFPLFERGDDGKIEPSHHPFTAPRGGLATLDADDPFTIESEAYDLVLNGYELGSGSIRIHQREVQERAFEMLGIDRAEAQEKFGFLLEGLEHGAPPHGGIALGLDRIAMLFAGAASLREVIAFPKTTSASALLEGAPSIADESDLAELHIRVEESETPG